MKMRNIYLFIPLTIAVWSGINAEQEPWTWLYKKQFCAQEIELHEQQPVLMFGKLDAPLFTQLVFSWNAIRPTQGHFSFWVQSRPAGKQQWSSWIKMMEWGAQVQRSFACKDHGLRYEHVRLEQPQGKYADAFRVKIMAHEGAILSDLQAIFVALSDFTRFTQEVDDISMPSVLIRNVPQKAQLGLDHPRNNHLCSPTSCSMLVSFLTKADVDPVDFAESAYDVGLNTYGSWPFNMAHAFERSGGSLLFTTARLTSFKALHQRLTQGIPVVVSVRGYMEGAPKVYESGHLLVVVGWDAEHQQVICNDPACVEESEARKRYPVKSFLAAWERSHRLAYIAEPIVQEGSKVV